MSFEEYVKNKSVIDEQRLDSAILDGVKRAKRNKPDYFKIIASITATAAVFFLAVNLNAKEMPMDYFPRGSSINIECSVILQKNLNEAIDFGIKLLQYEGD